MSDPTTPSTPSAPAAPATPAALLLLLPRAAARRRSSRSPETKNSQAQAARLRRKRCEREVVRRASQALVRADPEAIALVGSKDAEIYRCEFCQTLYRPDPLQQPNSYTLRY